MESLYILMLVFIINFVTVFIIDHSGILFDLSKFLYTLTGREWKYQMIGKPFGCSICMVWWLSLVYLLGNVGVIEALGLSAINALLSVLVKNSISRILEVFNRIK